MSSGEPSHFVNAVSNPARHTKSNRATLDMVCAAAYQGDMKALEVLLKSGDEDNIFNGDLNMHFTDVSALHMAAMAGNADCVKLLLEAKADPHLRTVVSDGKDPQTGEKPQDKAKKFEHNNIADILRKAEESTPPGRYQPDGISNNKKLYGDRQPSAVPKEVKVEAPVAKPAAAAAAPAAAAPAAAAPAGGAQKPSMPVALLFPGQGSQYVKMLDGVKDLPEVKDMLEKAKEVLGFDLLELCLQGPEDKLSQTKYCQPAMFVGGLAGIAKLRKEKGDVADRPQCVAGLSLGEYTALTAAGVFDFETGLRIVKIRAEAMQAAAEASAQSMVSVAGLSQEKLSALCQECCQSADTCQIANFLFPNGFACAGNTAAIERLQEKALATEGCLQAKLIKTSGGFHTALMQSAKDKLLVALQEVEKDMTSPRCDVYMNLTGTKITSDTSPAEIIRMLGEQLVSCVQWEPSMRAIIKDGITEFYECGPNKQLKAMLKRIDPNAFKVTTSVEV
mmetsp:Transcript_22102/g.56548  ORF Transcript_22102/g.56548 Transcript_22102/m.56548 type:complete len:505 (-) Transcript_22102:120-1634(-)